jgi:hypothetical protein
MKEHNDLLALQVGTGLAAIVTAGFTLISALFMIVSIATGCIHIYEFIKRKRKGL